MLSDDLQSVHGSLIWGMWPGLFNSNDGDVDVVRDLQQPASEGQHPVGAWELYVREER